MSTVGRITALLICLVAAAAVLAWPRGATADKLAPAGAAVGACAQWEVMLAPPGRVALDTKALPAPGKSIVEQAPAGWEPFAFTPTGALVYRRCAK